MWSRVRRKRLPSGAARQTRAMHKPSPSLAARQAVQGVIHASVGREMWNSVEEEYFAAMDDFETMVLPSQDAALGENPDAEEDPSVMEKILSPIGKALQDAVSAIAGS